MKSLKTQGLKTQSFQVSHSKFQVEGSRCQYWVAGFRCRVDFS